MLQETFESKRLKFKPITLERDLLKINNLYSGEEMKEIFKYMIQTKHENLEDTRNHALKSSMLIEGETGGHYTIHYENRIIGELSYNEINRDTASMGIWLLKDYWGNGFCKESLSELKDYLVEEYSQIIIATHKDNKRAKNVFHDFARENEGEYLGVIEDYKVGRENMDSHIFIIPGIK
jgi:RimJ/RimL family protein N-acetyltransferase